MKQAHELLRPHMLALRAYESARSAHSGGSADTIFLDANENPLAPPALGRYPADPSQQNFRDLLAARLGVQADNLLLTNGSDEGIDLLVRAFCEPRESAVALCPPTFGMYKCAALANSAAVQAVPLVQKSDDYGLNLDALLASKAQLLFIPRPASPTGTLFSKADIQKLAKGFGGVLCLDEAYIEWAHEDGFAARVSEFPRLVVLRTFSKFWGLAAERLGVLVGSPQLVGALNALKMPYSVHQSAVDLAQKAVENIAKHSSNANNILECQQQLAAALSQKKWVKRVFPSAANFLWVECAGAADALLHHLQAAKIIARGYAGHPNCFRISAPAPADLPRVLAAVDTFSHTTT